MLRAGSKRDVLRSLWEHDPFEVESRCIEHLDGHQILLDLDELHAHSLAYIAQDAPDYDGEEALEIWIAGRIARAAELLLDKDREGEREALPIVAPYEPRYVFLSGAVGIEPGLGRRACILFNSLPPEERRAFWAVQVAGKSIEELVAEGHGPIELARRRLSKVVQALRSVGDLEFRDEDDGPFRDEAVEGVDEP